MRRRNAGAMLILVALGGIGFWEPSTRQSFAQAPGASSPQSPAERSAIRDALTLCRSGQKAQAIRSLADALQRLPQAHQAAQVLVRLGRDEKLEAQLVESMEGWTIPSESDEVGLPSAWLSLRGQLLPADQEEAARAVLIQALAKSREPRLAIAEELAVRSDESSSRGLEQQLRSLNAAPVNIGLLNVVLAQRRGNFQLALELLDSTLRQAPDNPELNLLRAKLLDRLSRPTEGVEAAERAMIVTKRSNDTLLLPAVLLHYGKLLVSSGRATEAEPVYRAAEKAADEICDVRLKIRCQVARGELLRRSGRYSQAESIFRDSLKALSTSSDAHAALARLLDDVGTPDAALEHYEAAVSAVPAAEDRSDWIAIHGDWGAALASLGQHREALKVYRSGLEAALKSGDRSRASELLLRASRSWISQQDPAFATQLIEAARAAARDAAAELRARVDCELADARLAAGSPDESLAAATNCQQAAEAARVPGLLVVRAQVAAARALNDQNRGTEALTRLGAAPAESLTGSGSGAVSQMLRAEWLLEQGRASLQTQALGTAAASLLAASKLAAGGGRTDLVWRAHLYRARVATAQGDPAAALAALEASVNAVESLRGDLNAPGQVADRSPQRLAPYVDLIDALLPAVTVPERPAGRGSKNTKATPVPASMSNRHARAWEIADRRAGRRFRDMLTRPQDAAVTREELRLAGLESSLSRELLWVRAARAAPGLDSRLLYHLEGWLRASGLPTTTLDELGKAALGQGDSKALEAFLEQLEERLAGQEKAALTELAGVNRSLASLYAAQPATLAGVQRVLAIDEVITFYLLDKGKTLALSATKDKVWISRLKPWSELQTPAETVVQTLRRPPRAGVAFQSAEATLLYQSLVEALLTDAGASKPPARLTVIADPPLSDLPFAALTTSQGGFLLETTETSSLPTGSWRIWSENDASPNTNASNSALLFGSPFVPGPDEEPPLQLDSLSIPAELFRIAPSFGEKAPRNPSSSAVEVQTVAFRLSNARVLLEGDADEDEAHSPALTQAWAVHFAAPAIADIGAPRRSGVVLARKEGGKENGFLDVPEIVRLRLKQAVVTLTGSEALTPGGVQFLETAFLLAGARSVVATLWLPEEDASVYLMDRYYQKLQDSGPSAALRTAQLALLHAEVQDSRGRTLRRLSHPHFWAAFQIAGER